MKGTGVKLREFVLFKPQVIAEIFQLNSYQPNMKIILACNTQMPATQFPQPLILTVQLRSWGGRRESLSPGSLGRGKPDQSSDRSDDDILSPSSGMPARRPGASPCSFICFLPTFADFRGSTQCPYETCLQRAGRVT